MALEPKDVLAQDKRQAALFAERAGLARLKRVLKLAADELTHRLAAAPVLRGGDEAAAGSFTMVRRRVVLEQVNHVTRQLSHGMRSAILGTAGDAVDQQAAVIAKYMRSAEQHFRGVGRSPLQLDEAGILVAAKEGAGGSLLRRIQGDPQHPGRPGVLQRYGSATVGHFEEVLAKSFVAKTPWEDVKQHLTERSPFLQGAPAHWAERIVRTEVHGAQQRAAYESVQAADEQLGDMLKILAATFDERTGSDSYAIHGQIRRPAEAFESWFGLYQHPPNRPNDREVVVPHRMSWPLPPYLAWKTDGEVAARWRREGHKTKVPPRPKMTTVPLEQIGASAQDRNPGSGPAKRR